MKSARTIFFAVIASVALACTNDPGTDNGSDSWDLDASESHDVPSLDVEAEDSAEDVDESGDVDDSDATDVDEDTSTYLRTLADYRQCDSDLDCPVGLGSCIKQVSLNRADIDGTETVALDQIFENLEQGRGVCTEVCTDSPEVCDDLSVNGSTSDPVEHTCQLVVLGTSPYPEERPDFPFDDQLDAAEMVAGQPFGAICRAPFELDDDISDSFCDLCTGSEDCQDDSLCWDLLNQAPSDGPPGLCLSPCQDDSECPLGFACDVEDDQEQNYCRPMLDTCTNCKDIDGNGFGTGRCADGAQAVTPHDCDDRNPDAYYFSADMEHPFPEHCADQDLNCNGLNDRQEQVGPDAFGAEHCTGCFMTCEGTLDNGERSCALDQNDAPICDAKCEEDADGNPLFANCDGDLATGCEVPIDDPTRLYYRDADGDGYGDPNNVIFACDPDEVPAGYVDNNYDCNDDSDVSWGGPNPATEICDGIDNNCDGTIDQGIADVGQNCETGAHGVCNPGILECHGDGLICVGFIEPGSQLEVCDGLDTSCSGTVDDVTGDQANTYYLDADGDGFGDPETGIEACEAPEGYVENNLDCDDGNADINPDADQECNIDPVDNNCSGATDDAVLPQASIWYEDNDGDGFGNENVTVVACEAPTDYVDDSKGFDCNDNDASINPDAAQQCNIYNPVDNNCSGSTDDAVLPQASIWYEDNDSDGFGNENVTVVACEAPTGYVDDSNGFDCNDNDANINPNAIEVCDGVDNNCDGNVDHGCPHGWIRREGNTSTAERLGVSNSYSNSYNRTCNGNRVWVDARVALQPGSWPVQMIDVGCEYMETEANTNTTPYSYDTVHSGGFQWVYGPGFQEGGNGTTETVGCNDGEAIYKISVNFDGIIQNVTFHCRSYNVTGPQTGTTFTLNAGSISSAYALNGSMSGTNSTKSCEENQVAVGATFHHGTWNGWQSYYGIDLKCEDIDIRRIE